MRKTYQLLLALGFAASITSCSRSSYVASQQVPNQLSSAQSLVSPVSGASACVVLPAATLGATHAEALAIPVRNVGKPTDAPIAKVKNSRTALAQRLLLKKFSKQLAKFQTSQQSTVEVAKHTSNRKIALFVTLAGLVIIFIGGLIGGINVVASIGGVVFLTGLIYLIIALINKN